MIRNLAKQEAGAHEGRPHYDFVSLSKELLPPGALFDKRTIPFNFRGVEKIHEVRLRMNCEPERSARPGSPLRHGH